MLNEALYDKQVLALIPHRPPMLLIHRLLEVSEHGATAALSIDASAPFFAPGKGVPSWIGLEYMGQTAALIAGYQLQQGLVSPHLGFVLGTRRFAAKQAYFTAGSELIVRCRQQAFVGESLANFHCEITVQGCDGPQVEASLAVIRQELPSHE